MLTAGAAGVLLGILRGWLGFSMFGIQALLAGGLLGYGAGRPGRRDPGRFWTFSQRIWLALSTAVVFIVAHLIAASAAHAGPIDAPLYWLGEVADGSLREPFLSVKRGGSASGVVTGGWWIAFTILDVALLAFTHIAGSVMALSGGAALEPDETAPVGTARNACLAVVALVAVGATAYAAAPWQERPDPYSTANIARISRLSGAWRIADGQGVFADSEGERQFTLKVAGFNALTGTSAEPGLYELSLDNEGEDFRGRLRHSRHEGFAGLPMYFRMRPSSDDAQLIMVFDVYSGGGRRAVTVVATRAER
jgi:hypothetical protein